MNAKLLFKTIFLMVILLLLVMMGIYNKSNVSFSLPPILPRALTQPAGIMYIAFFAIGFLAGTIMTAGSGGSGKSSGSSGSGASKPSKSSKS